jgi:hypothetical protein
MSPPPRPSWRGRRRTSYAGADTPDYDLIGQVEAVFNRLILYRGHVLHAALLGPEAAARPIPAKGPADRQRLHRGGRTG